MKTSKMDRTSEHMNCLWIDKKIILRKQIFYDGKGTKKPLRGHSASHNIGIFFTIQNLPHSFNSCYPNIDTFTIYHALDFKYFVFDPILDKFMLGLNTLETDGYIVNIPNVGEVHVFGSLSQFTGDCFATNEIFGMICDFSHDFHCNMYYSDKQTMSTVLREETLFLRTKQEHANDIVTLRDDVLHVRGIKTDSVVNRSKYFHISESLTLDIMHILPEGVLPYTMSCIL